MVAVLVQLSTAGKGGGGGGRDWCISVSERLSVCIHKKSFQTNTDFEILGSTDLNGEFTKSCIEHEIFYSLQFQEYFSIFLFFFQFLAFIVVSTGAKQITFMCMYY